MGGGQKPIDVRAAEAAGKPYGRRAIWLHFRELAENGPVIIADLVIRTRISRRTIRDYMESLVKGGFAGKTLENGKAFYELIRDTGFEHPRLNGKGEKIINKRDRMWMQMKILGTFSSRELAFASSNAACVVSPEDAKDYCSRLHQAGYLQVMTDATHNSQAVYRLIPGMRTGPLAPMVQRTKVVFDPNLNRVMWHEVMEP